MYIYIYIYILSGGLLRELPRVFFSGGLLLRSAQVRAYDDRAQCRKLAGTPFKGACALSSYALTYVALIFQRLVLFAAAASGASPRHIITMIIIVVIMFDNYIYIYIYISDQVQIHGNAVSQTSCGDRG